MTTFFGPSSFLRKCLVNLKVGVQFGCIVYCTFEYVGEFVLVNIITAIKRWNIKYTPP